MRATSVSGTSDLAFQSATFRAPWPVPLASRVQLIQQHDATGELVVPAERGRETKPDAGR
jgi:hypothetical protein